jgi:hypothetical protein
LIISKINMEENFILVIIPRTVNIFYWEKLCMYIFLKVTATNRKIMK